jgi:hypothetical protein
LLQGQCYLGAGKIWKFLDWDFKSRQKRTVRETLFESNKITKSFSERFNMNGPRVHQNSWNFKIWFIIRYHKTRIFCFGEKIFFCRFGEFLKNLVLSKKKSLNHVIDVIVNNAFFHRFSWLGTNFEGNFVFFFKLLKHF